MSYTYVHLPENEDIGFDERSYSVAEETLEYNGRKVLYLYVTASGISFCDRSYAPHLANANVKGYIVRSKYGTDEKNASLSEIETIEDDEERLAIVQLLRTSRNIPTVNFV
ncbi:MAG: hypothetical protein V3S51_03625 [Dehalococcoidia bacterium]